MPCLPIDLGLPARTLAQLGNHGLHLRSVHLTYPAFPLNPPPSAQSVVTVTRPTHNGV